MTRFLIICQTDRSVLPLAVCVLGMNVDLINADWTNGGDCACFSAGVLISISVIYSGLYINTPESCSAFVSFFLFLLSVLFAEGIHLGYSIRWLVVSTYRMLAVGS